MPESIARRNRAGRPRSLDGRSCRVHRVAYGDWRSRWRGCAKRTASSSPSPAWPPWSSRSGSLSVDRSRTLARSDQKYDRDGSKFKAKRRACDRRPAVELEPELAELADRDRGSREASFAREPFTRRIVPPPAAAPSASPATDAIAGIVDCAADCSTPRPRPSRSRAQHRPRHVGRLFNGRHGQSPRPGSVSLDRVKYRRTNPAGLDAR